MPCDNPHNKKAYKSTLDDINSILSDTDAMHIIIGGDFNVDFNRVRSPCTALLMSFIDEENLVCTGNNRTDETHSFTSKIDGYNSLLDHFLVSTNLFEYVNDYHIDSDGDNLSDHLPVCISLNLPALYIEKQTVCDYTKLKWHEATVGNISNYKADLDMLLDKICIPVV
jgi:exonuclease III